MAVQYRMSGVNPWILSLILFIYFLFYIADELEVLDEDSYQSNYGNECTFSTVLSDGRRVELLPGGEGRVVKPEERQEYASLVRRTRMTEFTKQVEYFWTVHRPSILLQDCRMQGKKKDAGVLMSMNVLNQNYSMQCS